MNKRLLAIQASLSIVLFMLFDAYTVFTFIRGELADEELDWIRLGAGDYSDIPFFSMYGDFGLLLAFVIFLAILVAFGIIINSRIARKIETRGRFLIPVIVCLINAIVFFIFMDQTSKHWLTWYGHVRTAPYTVDGFAKALAYGNYIYYLEFVLENILFLIVAFVSNIIAKRKSRK